MHSIEYFDHTADFGMVVKGDTFEDVLRGCVLGMCDQVVKLDTVESKGEEIIHISSDDIGMLVVDLLTELLYVMEVQGIVVSDVSVKREGNVVDMRVFGEELDTQKHIVETDIKAVTYHLLEVTVDPPYARVLFDI